MEQRGKRRNKGPSEVRELLWTRKEILDWLRGRVWLDLEEAHQWINSHESEIFRRALRFTDDNIEECRSEAHTMGARCPRDRDIVYEWFDEVGPSSVGLRQGTGRLRLEGEP